MSNSAVKDELVLEGDNFDDYFDFSRPFILPHLDSPGPSGFQQQFDNHINNEIDENLTDDEWLDLTGTELQDALVADPLFNAHQMSQTDNCHNQPDDLSWLGNSQLMDGYNAPVPIQIDDELNQHWETGPKNQEEQQQHSIFTLGHEEEHETTFPLFISIGRDESRRIQ